MFGRDGMCLILCCRATVTVVQVRPIRIVSISELQSDTRELLVVETFLEINGKFLRLNYTL